MSPAQFIMKGLIRVYQWGISPFLPGTCRYEPTCSEYALQAVNRFGGFKGGWLALKRILRCHPWGGWGYDPVPDADGAGHTPSSDCRCGHHRPTR